MKEEITFKDFFKNNKTIKQIPPIPKDFDTKHLQEFIKEFEQLKKENEKLRKQNTEYQDEIFARDNSWYDMQD